MKAILGGVALQLMMSPAFAVYTGSPVLPVNDQSLDDWISSLYSEFGRCCDKADSIDPQIVASTLADSGLAVVYQGATVGVLKRAMHIFTLDDQGHHHDVTNNLAGVGIGWVMVSNDINGTPDYVVRCLLQGPLG